MEEVQAAESQLSTADKLCEMHFAQHTVKTTTGRFIVRLPFTTNPIIGASKEIAINRFLALERRLSKSAVVRAQYIHFMREYEDLGHMTKIDIDKVTTPFYVIPHQCVLKPTSSSTKLRVVFDASSKTSSGSSLNDIMHVGPTVQSELFAKLVRFRMPRFLFATDIEKMYRQILIHPDDRRYQLIIWRENETSPLSCYQLNTVTYGTRAAPYLATRCLLQLSKEQTNIRPLGARALKTDFYVDDCLTGADHLPTALQIKAELIDMLSSAGFKLRKWAANHSQLLQGIPTEDLEINLDLDEHSTHAIKTLGMSWIPSSDEFRINVSPGCSTRITKRLVSGEVARIFDPLGLLAPVVVRAKMFIQELWQLKLAWDEALPEELYTRWQHFRAQLTKLNNVRLPRHIYRHEQVTSVQIHAFGDASEKAYGAAVYLRAHCSTGKRIVKLFCAKSRVAPIKQQTIPRLELCAALLCSQLVTRIKADANLNDIPMYCWTDSEVVLSWINSCSSSFNTFVANRVSAIQELTTPEQWRHVGSKHNPADILSRGLLPGDFASCNLWLYGPLFLHGHESGWPTAYSKDLEIPNNIERKAKNQFRWRYINHSKINKDQRCSSHNLTPSELNEALKRIVQVMQESEFGEELAMLKQGRRLTQTNRLAELSPFIENGLIRVGGRLDHFQLSYDTKHQMLLPYNDPLAKLLMTMIHLENKHCGPQTLLTITRQRLWPIKGKQMARSVVHHCVKCTRASPQLYHQAMGNLPATRVTPARPFINAGVDYCGPFWIHFKLRGKRLQKAYLAIFCCFATKAVHIEVVSDLTTDAFIGALKRFIARRGHCQNLYCGNATNFVGAENKLKELGSLMQSSTTQEKVTNECNKKGISFKFIPPRAPHFGGLWESAVRCAKRLILRSVAIDSLTYEELETVAIEVEAILNSRPIAPMSTDANDVAALSPGHLLIGEPLTAQVDIEALPQKISLLSRWKLVSQLRQEFWQKWSVEYLHSLQERHKWKNNSPNIKCGTIVIIKEDNVPVMQWPLGRIIKTYPGNDGLVRVVDLKTATGVIKRPIHRLAPLLPDTDEPSGSENIESSLNEEVTEPSKKRRLNWTSTTMTIVVSLLLLPLALGSTASNGFVKITNFNSDVGTHFENVGTACISRTTWRLIIYYDLKPYWSEMATFSEGITKLQQFCNQQPTCESCKNILSTLKHIKTEMTMDSQLMAERRTKRVAVNVIGNVANALFGVLDSEYAKEMADTIQSVKRNEDHLMSLLRNQTSIIDSSINVFKQFQINTDQKFGDFDQQLNNLEKEIDAEKVRSTLFQNFITSTVQLHVIASRLQRIQAVVFDALTDAHHGTISPSLLSVKQLETELIRIKNHLPPLTELPVAADDVTELYKIMHVNAGLESNHVIFVVSVPLVDAEVFEIYRLIPIPNVVKDKVIAIRTCDDYLAVNAHRDQYFPLSTDALKSCLRTKDDVFLCSHIQTKYIKGADECQCEMRLLHREPKPDCMVDVVRKNSSWIQLNQINRWLFATPSPIQLIVVCGKEIFHITVENSGLLELQPGCIGKTKLVMIHAHQTTNTTMMASYTNIGSVENMINPQRLQHVTTKLATESNDSQLKRLTEIQTALEGQVLEFPAQEDSINQHHYITGYVHYY